MTDKKESLASQVAKNSTWGVVSAIVTRVGALVSTIILARFLLPEKFGLYSLALSICLFFMTFSNLGVDQTFIRYFSYAMGSNNKKKARAYFRYILRIKLIVVLCVSAALFVLAYPLAYFVFHKPTIFVPLLIFSFYIIVTSLEGFFSSVFTAVKRNNFLIFKESLSQVFRILLLLALFLSFNSSYYLQGVIIVMLVNGAVILGFSFYISRKLIPFAFGKGRYYKVEKRRILFFLGTLTLSGISGIFFSYIDSMILGIFLSDASYIGFYRAGYTFVFSVASLLAFAQFLLPFFASFREDKLEYLFNKTYRYIAILTVPASFGIIMLCNYFIKAIYGSEYASATIPVYILALLIFEGGSSGTLGVLFTARERPDLPLKALIVSSVMNIVLNITLILWLLRISPLWAIAGASISVLVSRYVFTINLTILARKKLGIRTELGFLYRVVPAGLVMSAFLAVYLHFIGDMNLFLGIIAVAAAVVVYFVALFLVGGLNKADYHLANEFIFARGKLLMPFKKSSPLAQMQNQEV